MSNQVINVSVAGRLPHELEALVGHYHEIIGKPSVFGPGKWSDIHTMAKWATTPERITAFINYIELIINTLPCSVCRGHANNYYGTNPPSKYSNYVNEEGRNIGMFYWSWIFHNTVNQRLRKPLVDLDVAFALYPDYNQNVPCSGNCGNETTEPSTDTKPGTPMYPIQPHQYTSADSSSGSGLPIMKSTLSIKSSPVGFRPGGARRK